jgi:hypothetical protein
MRKRKLSPPGRGLAWEVKTAREHETTAVTGLLDALHERDFAPQTVAMDRAYDNGVMHDACADHGAVAIFPLRETPTVKRGDHLAPECEHGRWTFAGADFKRQATKWRCPTGECQPKSIWRKSSRLHPLIPRESKRWHDLYRGRAAIEREFGRLKHEYGLAPIRVRGIERVALHADLTMLARLSLALARAQAIPLAA